MDIPWDTTVRFFPGNGEPGFRCTFRGCLAVFAGMLPDERFAAYATFDHPVSIDGRHITKEIAADYLETALTLLKSTKH